MAASGPQAIQQHPCARFIRAAQQIRERIKRDTAHAGELRDSIAMLQGGEQSDPAKVRLLERELARVEQQIHDEQAGLQDFELEISLNC